MTPARLGAHLPGPMAKIAPAQKGQAAALFVEPEGGNAGQRYGKSESQNTDRRCGAAENGSAGQRYGKSESQDTEKRPLGTTPLDSKGYFGRDRRSAQGTPGGPPYLVPTSGAISTMRAMSSCNLAGKPDYSHRNKNAWAAPQSMSDILDAYRRLQDQGEIEKDAAQDRVVRKLDALSATLSDYALRRTRLFARSREKPKGLYIHGGVGRGKSMLMDLFFAEAPLREKRRVHFHAFMIETHAAINSWRKLDLDARVRYARQINLRGRGAALDDPIPAVATTITRQATLLCFDEFEVRDVADAMILGRLFSVLFEAGTVIVTTSNRAPEDLYKDGLNRQLFLPFIDLIRREQEVVHLDGQLDYRLERLRGMAVYHTPLDAKSAEAMDEVFRRLTGHADGVAVALDVQGRMLQVPRSGKGVARFSFGELCERPLGAADYLALADEFHTLLLDNIPIMDTANRNEARRFSTLIDALYESRVKLICSAAALPHALYPAGDGAFEFARTVSRLMEMQSEDYMAAPHAPQ